MRTGSPCCTDPAARRLLDDFDVDCRHHPAPLPPALDEGFAMKRAVDYAAGSDRPLCVDLDGTLIRSDLLVEAAMKFVRQYPLRWYRLVTWLLKGRAELKCRLAEFTDIAPERLPLEASVVKLLTAARQAGRHCILVTASPEEFARKIADQTGLFDDVFATRPGVNLAGKRKAQFLREKFGDGKFDYVGNDRKDLAIWRFSHTPLAVNATAGVVRSLHRLHAAPVVLPSRRSKVLLDQLRSMRPHQWAKNLLIFVPIITSHQYSDRNLLLSALLAFACFSLAASAVYIVNDLMDLDADRAHPRKRFRPIPAGDIDIRTCLLTAPVLVIVSIAISSLLPATFVAVLVIYLVITSAYSISLKNKVIVDVICLASLYTIRVIAGGMAINVEISFWLLAFSMFLFLSLALVKRYTEIVAIRPDDTSKVRGYRAEDGLIVAPLGIASGLVSVLVLALYINTEGVTVLYSNPKAIWLICPIMLYWISRIWIKSHRQELHDDPVVFALTDRTSLFLAALTALAFFIATRV